MIPMNVYPASSVVPIFFATYDSNDPTASVTLTGLAVTDIEIYKGTSMTQRASDAGYALLNTDGIDVDGITGIHGFSVDLGDNTDAGFYAVGSFYTVIVSAITVDGATINFIADRFRIVPAEALAGHPKVDVGGWLGTAPTTPGTAGVPNVDAVRVSTSATAADNLETAALAYSATRGLAGTALPAAAADAAGGLPISDAGGLDLDSKLANTNEVTAARMGALTDWINGGRLDLLLDAVKAVTDLLPNGGALTSLATQASVNTIDDFLDTEIAAILAAVDTEVAAILADTNELQTDWANGGRLDLLIDAIKAVTDAIGATGTGLSAIPWNAAWDAEVQSDVNDALDTAISELGVAAPTATPTIRTALMLLYMALRNKLVVQTSGTDAIEIYNDAGTKIASKAITDDGADYTEAEMA